MLNPYTAMEILSLVFMFIILGSVLSNWKKAEIQTKLFALTIVLTIIGTVCDAIAIQFTHLPITIGIALECLIYIIGNTFSPVFSYYCMYQANVKTKIIPRWIPRAVLIANGLVEIIILVCYFTETLFPYIDGEYTLGPAIYISYGVGFISSLFLIVVMLIYRKKLPVRLSVGLWFLLLAPLVGSVIELLIPGTYVSYSAISVSILIHYVMIQSRLISEAEIRNKIESEVSRTDVMTGIPNRRAYTELMDGITESVCCGAMFFDVNGLKKTNDEHGHIAGDRLITTVADLLRNNLKSSDLFRISGDEFVAIYLGESKKGLFEKEEAAVRNAIIKNNSPASMGSSFGENIEIEKLVSKAEENMYKDKQHYYISHKIERRVGR